MFADLCYASRIAYGNDSVGDFFGAEVEVVNGTAVLIMSSDSAILVIWNCDVMGPFYFKNTLLLQTFGRRLRN